MGKENVIQSMLRKKIRYKKGKTVRQMPVQALSAFDMQLLREGKKLIDRHTECSNFLMRKQFRHIERLSGSSIEQQAAFRCLLCTVLSNTTCQKQSLAECFECI